MPFPSVVLGAVPCHVVDISQLVRVKVDLGLKTFFLHP